ncbi:DsbA family oxidoreductase [Corallococcus sp. H22C18031201]|uniref:DsbA family oxidoreductase n=1 Tax=Citreicoccus inhibens TaxID=2849499 RepID=UPI000E7521E1|nr:DsbA family oxidoreductase [Citreicoccus inhibens]MBU8898920.1 DsbA family oxidoreductase [Citreicoccus inhibens]RJS18497.1 DsbA family oxidoreductase [Corallococcus sp. H22C18031201]
MSTPVTIRVWSDFVCPWCYVGLSEVEKLRKEYDVQVDWRPFFLRPETPPEGLPLPEYVRERMKDPNNPLKVRAAQAGLTMVHRDIIPSTRRAHEATEFARDAGKLDPFHAAVLRRYWTEGQNLWEFETLRGAAQDAGVDPDALQRALEEGRYTKRVEESVREAQGLGVNAVPTFVLGERFALQGAQEYDIFRQAMQRLGATPRAKQP